MCGRVQVCAQEYSCPRRESWEIFSHGAEVASGCESLTVGAGIQTLVPCKSGKGSSPLWEQSLKTRISPIFNMLLQGQVFMFGFSWWHVYVCASVCALSVCVCCVVEYGVCVCRDQERMWTSLSITLSLIELRQGLSRNSELGWQLATPDDPPTSDTHTSLTHRCWGYR